jgi:beta-1,3-galactosyltransferase 1
MSINDPKVNLSVREESTFYKDILLENFYESYNNLTIKSLMMIKFATMPFVSAKFIFKVSQSSKWF